MPPTRTLYLTREQRTRRDALSQREGQTLAQLVREALDAYLARAAADPRQALDATFGALPDLEVPARGEWDRTTAGERPR